MNWPPTHSSMSRQTLHTNVRTTIDRARRAIVMAVIYTGLRPLSRGSRLMVRDLLGRGHQTIAGA